MQISQTWLRSLIGPEWDITADTVEEQLVALGIEVENRTPSVPFSGPVVIARVEHIEELTEFKKPIRYCQVNIGAQEHAQIICGARNFAEGDTVVAALPGAVLPGDFRISARKTYGKTSEGMLCAAVELGLAAHEGDEAGIMILGEDTPPVGTPLVQAWELNPADEIFELDITPDKTHLLSARGIARELASINGTKFVDPVDSLATQQPEGLHGVYEDVATVIIEPSAHVERFALQRVDGANPHAKTPRWIQLRLAQAGIRSINLAADVTNYVMLELGQPLHAFDAHKVGQSWTVRAVGDTQKFTTLDGKERTLDPEDVVIADEHGILSLAGVMGGAQSEVSEHTTDVIFEAAVWNAQRIHRTSRRHKLYSEASKRLSRGIDPLLVLPALKRATELFAQYSGGHVTSALTDQCPAGWSERAPIEFSWDMPSKVVGIAYTKEEILDIFHKISCTVEDNGEKALVQVPSWRTDVNVPIDLVEEIVRFGGLDRLPSYVPVAHQPAGYTDSQRLEHAIVRAIAGHGCVEVLDPVFTSAETLREWNIPPEDPRYQTVEVLNPLDNSKNVLPTTLLPELFSVTQRNIARGNRNVSLFSRAQVSFAGSGKVRYVSTSQRPSSEDIAHINEAIPRQEKHIAAVFVGERVPSSIYGSARKADYSDAIELARIIARTALIEFTVEQAEYVPFHPGRCARLSYAGKIIGYAGEIHPVIAKSYNLPAGTAACELNLAALPVHRYRPVNPQVSVYPPVLQDLAVVVDEHIPESAVRQALVTGSGDLLESISLYDIFVGEQLGEGKKSLTYSLRFRSVEKTLTEDEASAARDAAVARAHTDCGAVIRGPEYQQQVQSEKSS